MTWRLFSSIILREICQDIALSNPPSDSFFELVERMLGLKEYHLFLMERETIASLISTCTFQL